MRSTLELTEYMSGIHMEFTGDILRFVWVLQEKCLRSHLMTTDDIFLVRRIRRAFNFSNN